MAQELYLRNHELTLVQADHQSMLTTEEENLTKVINMLFKTATKHQDIIYISKTVRLINEDGVHQPLKSFFRVPDTKRQAQELEHSKGSDDRRLANIFLSHGNLVVTLLQIQLRKDCGTGDSQCEMSYVW